MTASPRNESFLWPHPDLPTMDDLPSEDPEEPGLPDDFHVLQPQLLSATFRPPGYEANRVYTGANINIYFDSKQTRWHKRPDWFAVLDVPQYPGGDVRWSYVVWQERAVPLVVVELLSPGTREEDLGLTQSKGNLPSKWVVYEQILRVPYYVTMERRTNEIRAFRNVAGTYVKQLLPESRLWVPEAGLGLGRWQGTFEGLNRSWLRWFDRSGQWVLTGEEQERSRAEQEQLRAEQERSRAERERSRAERLAERLRSLGIDPDEG